jgi:hypothetical protein
LPPETSTLFCVVEDIDLHLRVASGLKGNGAVRPRRASSEIERNTTKQSMVCHVGNRGDDLVDRLKSKTITRRNPLSDISSTTATPETEPVREGNDRSVVAKWNVGDLDGRGRSRWPA